LKLKRRGFIIKDMTVKSNSKMFGGKYKKAAEIQAAVEYGIDVTMLVDNIGRSYSERIKRHQIALNTIEKLKEAKRL
jgi:hypothetical protein